MCCSYYHRFCHFDHRHFVCVCARACLSPTFVYIYVDWTSNLNAFGFAFVLIGWFLFSFHSSCNAIRIADFVNNVSFIGLKFLQTPLETMVKGDLKWCGVDKWRWVPAGNERKNLKNFIFDWMSINQFEAEKTWAMSKSYRAALPLNLLSIITPFFLSCKLV